MEIKNVIEDLGRSFKDFKDQYGGKLDKIIDRVEQLEIRALRPRYGGEEFVKAQPQPENGGFMLTVQGQKIPALKNTDKLTDHFRADFPREDNWSLGDFVRGSMGLKVQANVLERGSATVPIEVSTRIIDAIRAKARVIQAGAVTIPIEGPTNVCRIANDATVSVHTEGANDIAESVPVFEAVLLDPKTLACLIPLSLEIVQDSPNLDAALTQSLSGAFAAKLDALSIAKLLADANIPKSAVSQNTDTWGGVLSAVGSMLELDMDLPKAMICSPASFIARASQLANTAGTWLGAPPALKDMLDLETTSMPDGFAILGDFSKGFAIAVRQEFRLEVVRFGKPTHGSHYLVAFARIEGFVTQPKALYKQVKTVTP